MYKDRFNKELIQNVIIISALAGIHIFLNSGIEGPIIGMDEFGFVNKALALSGHHFFGEIRTYPGYSFLLAPIYYFFENPDTAYFAVQLLNIFLVLCNFFILQKIVCLISRDQRKETRFIIGVVLIYPFISVFSSLAMSEIALFTFLNMIILLLALLEKYNRSLHWMILGILLGICYSIHARAIPLVFTGLLIGLTIIWKTRKVKHLFFFIFPVLILIFYKELFLDVHISKMIGCGENCDFLGRLGGSEYKASLSEYWNRLINNWKKILITSLGQFSYILLATFGIILYSFKRVGKGMISGSSQFTFSFILISFALTFTLSVMHVHPHIDGYTSYALYGRYNEIFVPVLLLLGFTEIKKVHYLFGGNTLLFLTFLSFAIIYYLVFRDFSEDYNGLVVSSFWPYFTVRSNMILFYGLVNSLIFIIFFLLIRLKQTNLVIGTFFIIFISISNFFKDNWLIPHSKDFHQAYVIDDLILNGDLYKDQKIYFNIDGFDKDYFFHNYILFKNSNCFYGNQFQTSSFAEWESSKGPSILISLERIKEPNVIYFSNYLEENLFVYEKEIITETIVDEFIDETYISFLNRYPDENGKKFWSDHFADSFDKEKFVKNVLRSEEFQNLHAIKNLDINKNLNFLFEVDIECKSKDLNKLITEFFERIR